MGLHARTIGLALVLSLAIHGLAAVWFFDRAEDEESMVEGGPTVQMAVTGDPFNAVSAGQQHAATRAATARPTPTTSEARPSETPAQPTPPAPTTEPVEPASGQPAETAALAETRVVAEPNDTTEATKATVTTARIETATPSAPTRTLEGMAPAPENVPEPDGRPEQPEERRVAENVPLPTETPNLLREPEPEPQPRSSQASRQGNQGRQQTNARQGSRQSGQSAQSGGGGQGANAAQARTNYSGQILSRIRQAQRYPSAARSRREQGTAKVAFTISAGGGLSGVRLASSSGSSSIDNAAVRAVQRAAPFPAIPRAIGQSTMRFTVPIRFRLR